MYYSSAVLIRKDVVYSLFRGEATELDLAMAGHKGRYVL